MGLLWTTNHIHPTKTEFVTKEVHEHRAPTDESVRLLNEMQQAAADNMIRSAHLENNVLRDAIITATRDCFGDYEIFFRFIVNGVEVKRRFKVPKQDFDRANDQIICERVTEALAGHILAGLQVGMFKDLVGLGVGRKR